MTDAKNPGAVEDIEPCPFCGAEMAHVIDKEGEFWMHPGVVTDDDCFMSGQGVFPRQLAAWNHRIAAQPAAKEECPSCHGMNTACPDGCGRDPATGELNGTRLEPAAKAGDGELYAALEKATSSTEQIVPKELGAQRYKLTFSFANKEDMQRAHDLFMASWPGEGPNAPPSPQPDMGSGEGDGHD